MFRMGRHIGGSTLSLLRGRVLSSPRHRHINPSLTGLRSFLSYNALLQCTREQEGTTQRYRNATSALGTNQTSGTGAPLAHPIANVAVDHDHRMLRVCWVGGEVEVFPFVWLKDNCRCSSCYHAVSHSRLILMEDIDLEAQPTNAKMVGGGQQVDVVWQDGHRSTYGAEWLRLRGFSEENRRVRESSFRLARKYWGSESLEKVPEALFQELLTDDAALLGWLRQLEVFGFVKVNGAPVETGQVRRLAERIAFIRKTHYGDDFSVKAKLDPSNVAYLNGPLQLHADLPYYEYKPGVQFIHCVVQYEGVGGDTQVTDAVHVAHQLQQAHPEHYRVLTDTPVDWFDIGTDENMEFHKLLRLPMICTDKNGEIWRINLSQPQRNSHFSVPVGEVAAWYAALVAYHRLLADPQYCLQFKMIPGTILTFDNLRIVHGRTGYLSGQGERHVEGCYVDWDEVRSRRRVLESKLEPDH